MIDADDRCFFPWVCHFDLHPSHEKSIKKRDVMLYTTQKRLVGFECLKFDYPSFAYNIAFGFYLRKKKKKALLLDKLNFGNVLFS